MQEHFVDRYKKSSLQTGEMKKSTNIFVYPQTLWQLLQRFSVIIYEIKKKSKFYADFMRLSQIAVACTVKT